jgi:hypothetical protein
MGSNSESDPCLEDIWWKHLYGFSDSATHTPAGRFVGKMRMVMAHGILQNLQGMRGDEFSAYKVS